MNDNKFTNAGEAFRGREARDFSARDQALARLPDIFTLCKDGVEKFYAAAQLGRPDVYVEMPAEHQVSIWYGFRPGRPVSSTAVSVVSGPFAVVFVTHEGVTLIGSDVSWRDKGEPNNVGEAHELPQGDWHESISDWLSKFLSDAERLYREIRH